MTPNSTECSRRAVRVTPKSLKKTGQFRYWFLGGCAFGFAMMPHLASRLLPFLGIIFVIFIALSTSWVLAMTVTTTLCYRYLKPPSLTDEQLAAQLELAEAVGVHPQTIGYIERRQYNLSLALAFRLATFFGLSLDAVFSPEPFELLGNDTLSKRGVA